MSIQATMDITNLHANQLADRRVKGGATSESAKDAGAKAAESVELSADEGHTLGELLGGNPLLEQLDSAMQKVGDLVITWITVAPDSPVVGQSLSDMELRTRTGAGVAAMGDAR